MDNERQEYNSIYRAFVVNNKDPDKEGKVLVWIPDIMPNVPQDQGLWARSANNPIGGRNDEFDENHNYMGSCYIPGKGSYVWIFFECGNINRPYYFGSLEPGNTKTLPENQLGSEYEHKWVVFKSREGRCVIISDDPDDRRVEITGKKRNLGNPPTGNTESVYPIDGNQSTILFDEREGKEKILLRTHKGDYLHIDIDERQLQIEFESDIKIKTNGNFYLDISGEKHIKSGGNSYDESGGDIHIKASGAIATDGSNRYDQSGASSSSNPENPDGERDT